MVSLKESLTKDPRVYVSNLDGLGSLPGKTLSGLEEVHDYQGEVFSFRLRFTDGSAAEFRTTSTESISVDLTGPTNV